MSMLWSGVFSFFVVSIVQLAVGEWQTSLALFGVGLYLVGIAMQLRSEGYHAEDVQDQTEPVAEFSRVKVSEELTGETIYELENGQVVTHREGLFYEPDSFKVS